MTYNINSFKAEVIADSSGVWSGNALRFPTEQEALDYAADLSYRWTAVRDTRVLVSNEPATDKFQDGKAVSIN